MLSLLCTWILQGDNVGLFLSLCQAATLSLISTAVQRQIGHGYWLAMLTMLIYITVCVDQWQLSHALLSFAKHWQILTVKPYSTPPCWAKDLLLWWMAHRSVWVRELVCYNSRPGVIEVHCLLGLVDMQQHYACKMVMYSVSCEKWRKVTFYQFSYILKCVEGAVMKRGHVRKTKHWLAV